LSKLIKKTTIELEKAQIGLFKQTLNLFFVICYNIFFFAQNY